MKRLQLFTRMPVIGTIRSPQEHITPPVSKNHDVVQSLKPENGTLFVFASVYPALNSAVCKVVYNGPRPANPLTAAQVGQSIRFIFAFGNNMPERCFFTGLHRMAFKSNWLTFEWLALDEIFLKFKKSSRLRKLELDVKSYTTSSTLLSLPAP